MKTFKIKSEVLDWWLAALRSGQYAQVKECLAKVIGDQAGYCCLGVLCEVAVMHGVQLEKCAENNVHISYDDEYLDLPRAVVEWSGLQNIVVNNWIDTSNPRVGESNRYASDLNDELNMNFQQIADELEKYAIRV